VAAPQYVFAYFPEFRYATYDRQLDYIDNRFEFRRNQLFSVFGEVESYRCLFFSASNPARRRNPRLLLRGYAVFAGSGHGKARGNHPSLIIKLGILSIHSGSRLNIT
jgi:hypothetical protein